MVKYYDSYVKIQKLKAILKDIEYTAKIKMNCPMPSVQNEGKASIAIVKRLQKNLKV
jgi:hypothetical protein